MGFAAESVIVNQLKKAQGETNERLDHLIYAVEQLTAAIVDAQQPVG